MTAGAKARRAPVRRIGLAMVVVAATAGALVTAGCAAGQYAQTATEQETTDGTSAKVGLMTLGGLVVQAPANGISWPSGANVPLNVVVVNSGQRPDTLTGITSPQISGWSTYDSPAAAAAASTQTPSRGTSVTVNGHSRVQFGSQQLGSSAPRVLLLNQVKTTLSPGMAIDLTFRFARAGSVTVRVPVQLSKSPQTSVIPGPSATGQEG